jgi:hypothetical protein
MPDPRADPRLTLRVWGYGVDVYIPSALLALIKQRVGHAAGEVLGEVVHLLCPYAAVLSRLDA